MIQIAIRTSKTQKLTFFAGLGDSDEYELDLARLLGGDLALFASRVHY